MKTAKASTDVMKGVMVLKVKSDGSAHVKKVSNYIDCIVIIVFII